jgi:competence protein ComEC
MQSMLPPSIAPLLACGAWALPAALLASHWLPLAAVWTVLGLAAAWFGHAATGPWRRPLRAGLATLPALLAAAGPPAGPPPTLPLGPVQLQGDVLDVVRTPLLGTMQLRLGEARGALRVQCDRAFEVLPGDAVRLLVRVGAPATPDGAQAVHAQGDSAVVTPGPPGPARFAAMARRACERTLLQHLPGEAGTLVTTLVLGRGTRPPGHLVQAHQATGLSHLLAVSGAHAAMLAAMVGLSGSRHRRRLGTHPRRTAGLLVLLAVYAAMTGNEPPVLRALISCALTALGAWLGRPSGIATGLLVPALFTCLVRPDALLGPSFLLSYAAVAGLALATPAAASGSHTIRGWLWSSLRASAWATLTTAPLTLCFFGQLAPWTVLLTPLLAPMVGAMLLGGLLLAVLGLIAPPLAPLLAAPLGWLAEVYAWFVQAADQLPATPVHALVAPAPALLGAFALLALVLLLLAPTRRRVALACALLALPHFVPAGWRDVDRCTLLAVGHGQACLVATAAGHQLAIDCGSLQHPFAAADRLVAQLHRRRLDLLVVTHADHDHHNGVPALLQRVPIERAIVPQALAAAPLLALLQQHGTAVQVLAPGERCTPAPHLVVTAPALPATASDNDQSLWVSVRLPTLSLLATGDAQELGTAAALASGAAEAHDVLVLPHHGRKNANAPLLLARVRPRACLASAASDDGETALGALVRRFGAELWVTGLHGDVQLATSPTAIVGSHAQRPLPP